MAYNFTAASSQSLATASTPVTALPLTIACSFSVTNTTASQNLVYLFSTANSSLFLLSNNGAASPKRVVQALALSSTGGISFGKIGYNTSAYSINTMYHAAAVFESATVINAFFNGQVGIIANASVGAAPTGINKIAIGGDGLVAEVGLWNAALTAAEIASLAKGMTCDKVRPQNLVFYAPLVRDLIDQKGGLTITNNNGATVANHPRIYP
jgi:hypothetical protein